MPKEKRLTAEKGIISVGTSLGIIIPSDFLEFHGIKKDDDVLIRLMKDGILITTRGLMRKALVEGSETIEGEEMDGQDQ